MINPGDKFSARRWNGTETDRKRLIDPLTVTSTRSANSESGTMVALRDARGKTIELDANWLEPYEE